MPPHEKQPRIYPGERAGCGPKMNRGKAIHAGDISDGIRESNLRKAENHSQLSWVC